MPFKKYSLSKILCNVASLILLELFEMSAMHVQLGYTTQFLIF